MTTKDEVFSLAHEVREFFPALAQEVHGHPVCFLDSAASAQKPQVVLDALHHGYSTHYANIHRGNYAFSDITSAAYEEARARIARFLGTSPQTIVLTRNTTESINLVAYTYGHTFLKAGDHVVVSQREHHSNFLPWQRLRDEKGICLDVLKGEISLETLAPFLRHKPQLVCLTHTSHVLGGLTPVKEIAKAVHAVGGKLLVDGAQRVAHAPVKVEDLGCDFYAFSGHKVYGPTGVGVLYAREELLEAMPPFMCGGGMVVHVTEEAPTWVQGPSKFEAGTPAIVEAMALAKALDFLEELGWERIQALEVALLRRARERLSHIKGVRLLGKEEGCPLVSFTVEGVHPFDLGACLDRYGVAVRIGHQCAAPLMSALGLSGCVRASCGVYTTHQDIDTLAVALEKSIAFLQEGA